MRCTVGGRTVFGSVEEEREAKRASLRLPFDVTAGRFFEALTDSGRSRTELADVLDFALSIDFSKSPLKQSYLTHPVRVATVLLRLEPAAPRELVTTALLHNVPETSDVDTEQLASRFGRGVADGVATLLVDRKVPFESVEDTYYRRIFEAGRDLALIKLLDKMDNLFVVFDNPDASARVRYVAEIRRRLLPFAVGVDASLGAYLVSVLDGIDALDVGAGTA